MKVFINLPVKCHFLMFLIAVYINFETIYITFLALFQLLAG